MALPVLAGLFLLAQSRLVTFANEESLWTDAIAVNRPNAALTLSPQRAYTNRGNARLAQGRIQDALEDFAQAARLDPSRAEYRDNADKLRAAIGG